MSSYPKSLMINPDTDMPYDSSLSCFICTTQQCVRAAPFNLCNYCMFFMYHCFNCGKAFETEGPQKPLILAPCAHNICAECMIDSLSCPRCTHIISSSAQNQFLKLLPSITSLSPPLPKLTKPFSHIAEPFKFINIYKNVISLKIEENDKLTWYYDNKEITSNDQICTIPCSRINTLPSYVLHNFYFVLIYEEGEYYYFSPNPIKPYNLARILFPLYNFNTLDQSDLSIGLKDYKILYPIRTFSSKKITFENSTFFMPLSIYLPLIITHNSKKFTSLDDFKATASPNFYQFHNNHISLNKTCYSA